MIKLMIFDLDGTLLDTIHDLAAATNFVLEKRGYKAHTTPEYYYLVGNGIYNLIKNSLPEGARTPENIEALKDEQLTYYSAHLYDNTKPFDGIPQALEALQKRGIKLAVVTNKPHAAAQELMRSFFPNIAFECVQGNCEGIPVKPNPAAVNMVIEKAGVLKDEVLYFGDSDVDMLVAKNAGVKAIGVLWGYRKEDELLSAGADIIIKAPEEIISMKEDFYMETKLAEIAQRIRTLREILEITQEKMAEKTGVSEEEYINLESGDCDFTFTFLYECSKVFGVDLMEIVTGENPKLSFYSIVRKGMGLPIKRREGFTYQHLAYLIKERIAEPFLVTAPYIADEQEKPIHLSYHKGQEFDFILKGSLKCRLEGHTEILNEGDAIYYDSGKGHGMIATGGNECLFLAVVFKNEEE